MLRKLCSKCKRIIPFGKSRCAKCEKEYQLKRKLYLEKRKDLRKEYYKDYNKNKRDAQGFYNSKSWDLTRKTINNRDRGLCRLCYSEGKIIYSDCVHHIEEVRDNEALRCSEDNLISLCNRCHREVHYLYKSKSSIIKEKLKEIIRDSV